MNEDSIKKTEQDKETEQYQHWEKAGYFAPEGNGHPYCIMLPPPNVTGSLHMGHAFQQTLMDILIRYRRMMGDKTLWQPGTDHASIATQMIVERQLSQKGISRHDLGRDKFNEEVWKWKETSGGNITRQMRRMGSSCDWSRERFTMDEPLSDAVLEAFIRLYDEGLIYRGKRLVNWDPVLLTAVSDLEVEAEEENGHLWYIRYPLENEKNIKEGNLAKDGDFIVVATTRPETLLGDVAVAVHPEDPRYQLWIGKQVRLPLTDRLIPVIADETVAPEFGTGAVKITPAHDFNDYAMGARHSLPLINIFTIDAKLNENAPSAYQGMDRFEARKKMVQELKDLHLLEKIEAHKLNVPRGDRSGAVLEPRLTDQWFVNVNEMAQAAINVVENGQIRFVPENWSKTYFEWMRNIQDWCISRQLWWGHRIPAWFDTEGNIYVGKSEQDVRRKYNLKEDHALTQETDVLDTWFSAALWPFSTLGWPDSTEALKTFYPTDVLITGFDIIFFWVARMIMFGLKFTGEIPFKEVYINGLILDKNGQKMSKTKGNVIDPLDLIDGIDLEGLIQKRIKDLILPHQAKEVEELTREEYPQGIPSFGTDALRFTFSAIATPSRFIRFDFNRIEGYRHFCNKLRNAARYVFMNTIEKEDFKDFKAASNTSTTLCDQWILSLWQKTKQAVHQHLSQYRFDLATQAIYEFTWNEYCDWYLEFSKPVLVNPETPRDILTATRHTLLKVLEELLRVIHPIMPYITEEIWQNIPEGLRLKSDTSKTSITSFASIMITPYPLVDKQRINDNAEQEINWIKSFVLGVRAIRGEMKIAPGKMLTVLLSNVEAHAKKRVEKNKVLIASLAKIESIHYLKPDEVKPPSATAVLVDLEILIPLSDLIDKDMEIARLGKEVEKLNKELEKLSTKLQNTSFIQNAPKEIVAQEQKRVLELSTAIEKLKSRRVEISKL